MTSTSEIPRSTFTLNNGRKLPAIGLGTFQGDAGNTKVKDVVSSALKKGYRHIDCATAYGNEKEVGQALQESGIPRAELFITTKLAQTWHQPADVPQALEKSLGDLQLDYVDLYLIHFPYAYQHGENHSTLRHPSGKPIIDHELSRAYPAVWAAMKGLVDSGKARSIGLSNFNILKTKRILAMARIRPAVNQVELHPYLPQHELLRFCKRENIHLMAHQPLGGQPVDVVNPNKATPGPLFDAQITHLARATSQTPAQTLLAWAVQRGTSAIPKTVHDHRLDENLHSLAVLREDHFQICDSLGESGVGPVRYLDPRGHVGFDVFSEEADEPVEG